MPTYSVISEDKEFTVFGLGGFLLHYMHTVCYENCLVQKLKRGYVHIQKHVLIETKG